MSRVEISQRSTRHEHMPNLASQSIGEGQVSGIAPKGKSGSGLFIEAVEYLGDQACC